MCGILAPSADKRGGLRMVVRRQVEEKTWVCSLAEPLIVGRPCVSGRFAAGALVSLEGPGECHICGKQDLRRLRKVLLGGDS